MPESFHRSANMIFGKIRRTASEDVVIQLTKSKCVPCLMYVLDACYLTKCQLNSLEFVINRLFIKLFKGNNTDIVKYCQYCFGFETPSELQEHLLAVVLLFRCNVSFTFITLFNLRNKFCFCT